MGAGTQPRLCAARARAAVHRGTCREQAWAWGAEIPLKTAHMPLLGGRGLRGAPNLPAAVGAGLGDMGTTPTASRLLEPSRAAPRQLSVRLNSIFMAGAQFPICLTVASVSPHLSDRRRAAVVAGSAPGCAPAPPFTQQNPPRAPLSVWDGARVGLGSSSGDKPQCRVGGIRSSPKPVPSLPCIPWGRRVARVTPCLQRKAPWDRPLAVQAGAPRALQCISSHLGSQPGAPQSPAKPPKGLPPMPPDPNSDPAPPGALGTINPTLPWSPSQGPDTMGRWRPTLPGTVGGGISAPARPSISTGSSDCLFWLQLDCPAQLGSEGGPGWDA